MTVWTQAEAIELCRQIEAIAPDYGAHVALTGGLLYKDGARKDADILFYRIRQVEAIDVEGLMEELGDKAGICALTDFGWCYKASYLGKPIDFFFPEREGDKYPPPDADDVILPDLPEYVP